MHLFKETKSNKNSNYYQNLYNNFKIILTNSSFCTLEEITYLEDYLFESSKDLDCNLYRKYTNNHTLKSLNLDYFPTSYQGISSRFLTQNILISDLISSSFSKDSSNNKIINKLFSIYTANTDMHFKCPNIQHILFFQFKNNEKFIEHVIKSSANYGRPSLLSLLVYLHFPNHKNINKIANLFHQASSNFFPTFKEHPDSWILRNTLLYPQNILENKHLENHPEDVFNFLILKNNTNPRNAIITVLKLFYFKFCNSSHLYSAYLNFLKNNSFDTKLIPHFSPLFSSFIDLRINNKFNDPYLT